MDHGFYTWLNQTVPSGQYNTLVVSLNVLRDLFGPEIDDLGLNIVSRIGYEDPFSMVDRLQSDVLNYLYAGARLFGITIREDQRSKETIGRLATLLRGLLTIEHYELVQALDGIIEGASNKEELVCELVAEVMFEDANDFIVFVQEVPDVLIERIRNVVKARAEGEYRARAEDPAVVEFAMSEQERAVLMSAFTEDDAKSPLFEYVNTNQRLGLTLEQFFGQFGNWVSNLKRPADIARAFLQIGLMAQIPMVEIPVQLSSYSDKLIGDIHRIIAVRKALIALVTEKSKCTIRKTKVISIT